ncbi:MAG: four helix bundle protein [Deltaproteobacteria bacterium HGW-Deltaproteobacteria-22]|jgi:four helix bundle protein|nr:MAG: four helix bundle protein [Deltaproteobacteria bacterium HGW-Deltaproteobacteria-22]
MARLVVLQIATHTAAAVAAARLVHPVFAKQLVRSSSSVALNIAEGTGRFGRDRLQHYRIAYGSCQEAKTTVEILVLSGHLDRETGRQWWADLHRIGGLLWGLMKSLQ